MFMPRVPDDLHGTLGRFSKNETAVPADAGPSCCRKVRFVSTKDQELVAYLTRSGVEWTRLEEPGAIEAECTWREIYSDVLGKHPRVRQGVKAEQMYQHEQCDRFLIVPFSSDVHGLPIRILRRSMAAYHCRGSLIALGAFHEVEFFICPLDYAWTMVHTHEDHAFGGPYFVHKEWLVQ